MAFLEVGSLFYNSKLGFLLESIETLLVALYVFNFILECWRNHQFLFSSYSLNVTVIPALPRREVVEV